MKYIAPVFLLLITVVLLSFNHTQFSNPQTVNPIIGDESFISKFGYAPDETTDNQLRIVTHLAYAEELLRNKDVSHLSPEQQENRTMLLDLLHDYWTKGIFPKNYDYADQRKPCFIDKDGTICAVGYLIEQTAGRDVAEQINEKFKYNELLTMQDEIVDNWIAQSGLTKEECATIQPTYGNPIYYYSSNYISPEYGISSSIFSGLNITLSAINAMQIGMGSDNKIVPVIGLISGTCQVAFGTLMLPQDFGIGSTNESQKALSMVNIGLGTATMMLGAWNLIDNKNKAEKLSSWNLYSVPLENNNTAVSLGFIQKF